MIQRDSQFLTVISSSVSLLESFLTAAVRNIRAPAAVSGFLPTCPHPQQLFLYYKPDNFVKVIIITVDLPQYKCISTWYRTETEGR